VLRLEKVLRRPDREDQILGQLSSSMVSIDKV
jgi:hypothetical protein